MKNEFIELIEQAQTIGIFGHIRPDGDCVGSCLGLYNYISENYQKNVTVYLDKIPDKFHFLNGAQNICHEASGQVLDLAVSVDCSDRDRHGIFFDMFGRAKHTACLDHHRSNQGFGDYFYCDPDASSSCEVLFRHLDENKVSLACAECLYLGIVHDTGVFKYSACKEETLQITGKLITKGVNAQKIIDETFYKVSYKQNLLMGHACLHAKLALEGKVIYTYLSAKDMSKFSCSNEETDGIVDRIRVVDGIEVAILAYQLLENGPIKFSMRSISRVDVSKIAVSFGGGGHVRASGFEAQDTFENVLNVIIKMVEEQL